MSRTRPRYIGPEPCRCPGPRVVWGQRASPPPLTHNIDNGSRVVIDRCGDRYGRWAAFGEYIHPSLDQTTVTNATTGLRGPSSVYRPQEVSSDDACARSYAQTLTDRAGTLLASHGMCARYCEQCPCRSRCTTHEGAQATREHNTLFLLAGVRALSNF